MEAAHAFPKASKEALTDFQKALENPLVDPMLLFSKTTIKEIESRDIILFKRIYLKRS
jgi:hypothetical protein